MIHTDHHDAESCCKKMKREGEKERETKINSSRKKGAPREDFLYLSNIFCILFFFMFLIPVSESCKTWSSLFHQKNLYEDV